MFKPALGLSVATGVVLTTICLTIPTRMTSASDPPVERTADRTLVRTGAYSFPDLQAIRYQGNNSCNTGSCHGIDHRDHPVEGKESLIWARGEGDGKTPFDYHQRAYKILMNKQSQLIARNLQKIRGGDFVEAHENETCLRCHGPNWAKLDRQEYQSPQPESAEKQLDAVVADGVGCEACHGPAERWLTPHYGAGWKSLSNAEKAKYGFYPTKDLSFRIQMCATCHVGADPGEDVNHDLYAAGHPRLAFEYTKHHYNPLYARHWTEKAYGADFEVRAWGIGQVASLRSAVDLLRKRAIASKQETNPAPWPELSEYSCYSCHHALEGISPRQDFIAGDRKPGAPGWELWYRCIVPEITKPEMGLVSKGFSLQGLDELVKVMQGSIRPKPDDVIATSQKALTELDALLLEMQTIAERDSITRPLSANQVQRLLTMVAGKNLMVKNDKTTFVDADWDVLSQHYLSEVSLYSSLVRLDKTKRNPELVKQLTNIRTKLGTTRNLYEGPIGFDPRSLLSQFQLLRDTTQR